MNTKFFTSALIAVASLASVNAFAAGADNAPEQQATFVSTQSRAEVRAAAAAVQKGPVTSSNQVDGGMTAAATPSQASRSEIRSQGAAMIYSAAPGRA